MPQGRRHLLHGCVLGAALALPGCGSQPAPTPPPRPPAIGLPIPLATPAGPCLGVPLPCAWSASEEVLLVVGSVARTPRPASTQTLVQVHLTVANRSAPGRSFTVTTLGFVLVDQASRRYDAAKLGDDCSAAGAAPLRPGDVTARTECYAVPTAASQHLVFLWSPGAGVSDLDYNDFAIPLS